MNDVTYRLVEAVEGLEVDFELHVNPDGSHTVHIRHGLPFGHEAANLMNELHYHRHDHCAACTGAILKSAGLDSDMDQASKLASLIRAAAHHNQHLAHSGDDLVCKPRTEADSEVRDRCVC
ncbi:MAG: hypothetical protein ABIQ18_05510 [Umezawaea sp.]